MTILNEKLSSAQSEMTTKENLVKQHAKVAEEAVSGIAVLTGRSFDLILINFVRVRSHSTLFFKYFGVFLNISCFLVLS